MSRYKIHLIILYLLNFSSVALSYYLDSVFIESKDYSGFHYLFILNLIYFFWAYHSKLKLKIIHVFIIGLIFIGSEPAFENDHYRYLWEGKVVSSGFNPYRLAPNSKELKHIHFLKKEDISYNKLTSIYPPLAQLLFLSLSPFEYRLAFCILQFLGLCMLIYILFNLFRDKNQYLVFILPYLFKEFVQAVHVDILAFMFLVICFKNKKYLTGIFLAFQVKILSIVCLPFLILKGIFKDRMLLLYSTCTTLFILGTFYLYPIKLGGYQSGAGAYIEHWSWNSLLGLIFLELGVDSIMSRYILLGLFSLSYLYLIILYIKNSFKQTWVMSGLAFQFLFLFTPVLHPWYMFWPLIFMRVNRFYFFFLASSVMAYYPYGNLEFKWFGESLQFVLLVCSIFCSLKRLKRTSHDYEPIGAKISIWLPSGSNTQA
jgi:alpha-1,6-mannosyltransferase